jgi:hypothetical protein
MTTNKSRNQYIRSQAVKTGTFTLGHQKIEYWICPSPTYSGGPRYNGYVCFPKRPTQETGYRGLLTYVPVHGGITYAEADDAGMVYGFDTMHDRSEDHPITDPKWIKAQCKVMAQGVLLAAKLEAEYLATPEDKPQERAVVCQKVRDLAPDMEMNFGMMINLLGGRL